MAERILQFDSWEAMIKAACVELPQYYSRCSRTGTYGTLSESFEHSLELARHWPEGTKQIEQMAKSISAKASMKIERTSFEFATHDGNAFDIGRFLRGEPECVLRMVRKQTHGTAKKVIRLVMNISASAMISTDVMIRRGAGMCAVAYCLHHAGYGTELRVVDTAISGEHFFQVSTLVKRASSNFDLGRMAFACAHPAMLRRLSFALLENCGPEFHGLIGHGYGSPCAVKGIQGDVILERALGGEPAWQSVEATTAWVLDTLKKQGIELKG